MPPRVLAGVGGHVTLHPFVVPMATRFRGTDERAGVLLSGPAGWGEFSPFPEYDDDYAGRWLAAAVEAARDPWPRAVRELVPVNATVPAVAADRVAELVRRSGARTAKVKVAEPGQHPGQDVERVAAVRDAIGRDGAVRVDANGAWDVDTAVARIAELDRAAGGLEYVEQPCRTLDELAAVRRRVDVRVAVDESIRTARDPLLVAAAEAADVVVLKVQPLGGVRRAMEVADACGLPVVVSSALETSIGLAAGVAFAAALPELPFACGLGTALLLARDVAAEPLLPVDGAVEVRRPVPTPPLLDAATPAGVVAEELLARIERVAAATTTYR